VSHFRLVLPISLVAAFACGQGGDPLEIRGKVFEIGPNAPLIGAQVAVYQFDRNSERSVFATVTTDSTGAFRFNPPRPGDYYVEVTKAGYFGTGASYGNAPGSINPPPAKATGSLLTLNREHPFEEVRFALMRIGEMSGKVVDKNGRPVSGLTVDLVPTTPEMGPAMWGSGLTSAHATRTGADGSFQSSKLPPGKYVVRVSSLMTSASAPMSEFTADDENAVDEAFEPSYWPGVSDQASASIFTLDPGGAVDLGSLTVQKGPRYRIHLSVRGCEPGEQLSPPVSSPGVLAQDVLAGNMPPELIARLAGVSTLPCKDLLLRGYPPGSYNLTTTTKVGSGVVSVTIADRNVTVPLTIVPNGDVLGRVITASGAPLPGPVAMGLPIRSRAQGVPRPDADGNFVLKDMPCLPSPLQTVGLSKGFYVKEVRVNGVAITDGMMTACAGSKLEIVLDDKVATLAVSVTDGDKPVSQPTIVVQKWPQSPLDSGGVPAKGDQTGFLQVTGLVPGEYRVMAVRLVSLPDGNNPETIIQRLWDRASKITLEPGETKSISLKVIDPFN
jgi:hypothetical protein